MSDDAFIVIVIHKYNAVDIILLSLKPYQVIGRLCTCSTSKDNVSLLIGIMKHLNFLLALFYI